LRESICRGKKYPEVHSIWKHVKSGQDVIITSHCLWENTLMPHVCYRHFEEPNGEIFARDLKEFMDGRFERLS
jgi:hypothetical protein